MEQVPMAMSVAGGVMLAAFFMVAFNWGLRLLRTGYYVPGVALVAGSLFYGVVIVIGSMG